MRPAAGLVLALACAVTLALAACGRPERPGPAPAPPPVPPAKVQPPPPETPPPAAERELKPPPASTKVLANMIYDSEQPCFTRGQVDRAREVLFIDFRHDDELVWMNGLNHVFYALHVDCADEDFLMLVLSTIQLESGVNVDPKIEHPDLERMFVVRMHKFAEDNVLLGRLIAMSGLEEALRNKMRQDTAAGLVRTEADLLRYFHNDLRPWLIDYFRTKFKLPDTVARRVVDAGLPNPVHTIGPLQVNVAKAYRNALRRGERVDSVEDMQTRMLDPGTALERGLKEGVDLLWRPYAFYRKHVNADEAVVFASADFNGGEFSSRNAAFQERLAELSGRPLALDGDLLAYRDGTPVDAQSNTEAAVNAVLRLTPGEIRRDLLLEKDAAFWDTDTSRALCRKLQQEKRLPCRVGRLPSGAGNELATLKHGHAFSPAIYARRVYQRFKKNSVYYASMGPTFLREDSVARIQRSGDPNPH